MPPLPEILNVPCADDALHTLAQHIAATHRECLPDLTHVVVLMPDLIAAPLLRKALLAVAAQHGHHALLGPTITTPRAWVAQLTAPPARVLDSYTRELLLTQALVRHPNLYGQANVWTLTDSLLRLFDELALQQLQLPQDDEVFRQRLATAYRVREFAPQALSREASLVHTLWNAWHEQLRSLECVDASGAWLAQLTQSIAQLGHVRHVYLAGFNSFCNAEVAWIDSLSAQCGCTLLLQGQSKTDAPDDAYVALQILAERFGTTLPAQGSPVPRSAFFDAALGSCLVPITRRAREFSTRFIASPVIGNTRMVSARNAEEEARAIDIQVRRWLLDGKQRIGIITQNRRLARRVRALLERAGIAIDDRSGWALSTTRAASALERWLESIEEDFAWSPLLDVLKSAFIFPEIDRDTRLNTVYRFEEDIVHGQNVARDINRYRTHLALRRKKLPEAMRESFDAVEALLDRLQHAADPLLRVRRSQRNPPRDYLDALRESLTRLGMTAAWQPDAAGLRLLQELELLQRAADTSALTMNWLEFRAWLARALEMYNFVPPVTDAHGHWVQLLNLHQGMLAHFDALVMASCEQEYLPGSGTASPFFNDGVRAELNLPTRRDEYAQTLHFFRIALERAPQVLLTRAGVRDGQDVAPSPWWETLQVFHELAYGNTLEDGALGALMNDPRAVVNGGDHSDAPSPATMPAPRIAPELLPQRLSSQGYQSLLDCPYQFFAAYGLKLAAAETVRETLQKDDFGNRVHLCLQAFHEQVEGFPAPFALPFTEDHRNAAIQHLERVAQLAFARDLENNFAHRGWLKRWLAIIPDYVAWQIKRATGWRVHALELKQQRALSNTSLTLTGRIDRIDAGDAGLGIIDYKTGSVPGRDEVLNGESIQLPYYALLLDQHPPAIQAEFVKLERGNVSSVATLANNELRTLSRAIGDRLAVVMQQLSEGQAAPAWGDAETCAYCAMEGLCRRTAWDTNEKKRGNEL